MGRCFNFKLAQRLSQLFIVYFFRYKFIESIKHRKVGLLVQARYHSAFYLGQLRLDRLYEIIDIFLAVRDFVFRLNFEVVSLNVQHFEVMPVDSGLKVLLNDLQLLVIWLPFD